MLVKNLFSNDYFYFSLFFCYAEKLINSSNMHKKKILLISNFENTQLYHKIFSDFENLDIYWYVVNRKIIYFLKNIMIKKNHIH